jgi:hypothetical protein
MPINLVLISITFPLLVFLFFPFGSEPSAEFIELIMISNFLFLLGAITYPLLKRVVKKEVFINNNLRISVFLVTILFISLLINVYFYYILNFKLPIFDTSLRKVLYNSSFGLWSLFITINMTLYLLVGYLVVERKCTLFVALLVMLNSIFIIGYGMKANILQMGVCYYFGMQASTNYYNRVKNLFTTDNIKKLLLILFLFWVINSARAGRSYGFSEFADMFYLYIIPPFSNFNNILTELDFFEGVFLGGLLQGIYKIIGISTNPLDLLSLDLLVSPTWNVWSFYANWYASGGLTEVYVSSLLIGLYISTSYVFKLKRANIFVMMNYSQMVIMCLTLHNSYYYQSASPILAMMCCFIIQLLTRKVQQ